MAAAWFGCLEKLPPVFYYVQFDEDSTSSTISFYDLKTGKTSEIVATLPGSEDFGIMPDGTFLMGSEGVLYKYLPGTDKDWLSIAEFEGTAVEKFYRIVVNPAGDKIAVVTYPEERP